MILKPINCYGGGYLISDTGRVFNKNGKERKNILTKFGYLNLRLCSGGVCKNFPVHRLVAMSFIDNPGNKPEVNHIDGDKQNNHVSNLEWVTRKENVNHSYSQLGNKNIGDYCRGRFGKQHHKSKAILVKLIDGTIKEFGSVREFARNSGCCFSIGTAILGRGQSLPYEISGGKAKGIVILAYPYIK